MTPQPPATPLPAPTTRLVVTPVLIALNVGVFAAMVAMGVSPLSPDSQALLEFGANFGGAVVLDNEWWRCFTAMFIHIGVIHLLVNMYSLWNVGGFVERLLGRPLFIVTYVLTGLAGSFCSVLMRPFTISAGASGAILGLFGVVIGFTFRAREQLPPTTFASLRGSILASLGILILLGMSPNIDNAAHIGGLAVGILAGVMATSSALERPGRRASWASQLVVLATVAGLAVLADTRTRNQPTLKFEIERARAVNARAPEQVIRHASAALAIKDDPETRMRRGLAYYALHRPDEALADLDVAIGAIDDAEALTQLREVRSVLRMQVGNYEGAVLDLRLILKTAPTDATANNNLAWALVRLGRDLDEALERADAAVKEKEEAFTLGTRCWVYAARGEDEKARADCEAAIKLKPDDVMDQGMLALIAGDKPKALELWERAAKDDPTYARDLEPWLEKARAP